MSAILKVFLTLIYPLLLAVRLLNELSGRDPLRLQDSGSESYWIRRSGRPDSTSYFQETSGIEGHNHGGWGWVAVRLLQLVARFFSPSRRALHTSKKFYAAADREQGIPDEVYTLW